jgi:tetratricopeptide (TPR) repeat protein
MRGKLLIISTLIVVCAATAFYYLNAESPQHARERYLARGRQYVNDGKIPEAVIMFKNAIQIDPNFAEARYELGLALMQKRDFPHAFAEFRRAVELNPTLIKARHQLGSLYLLERNITLAKEQLAKIRDQDPNALEARYLAAALALIESDPDRALKEIRAAVNRAENEKTPSIGEIYIELGNIHLLKKDWGEAEMAYRKALKLNPKLLRSREGLAALYMAKGDEEKARQELIAATKADPQNEDALHRLGNFYLHTKQLDEYEKVYRELVIKKPKSIVAKKKMVEILLNKGDLKTAKAYTEEILKAEPSDISALFFRGRIYLSEKEFRKAHDDFTKVTAADPRFAPGFFFLGVTQIGLSDIAQGRGSLLKALELSPNAIEPRLTLAEIYLNTGDPEAAKRESEIVLTQMPENRTALLIGGAAQLRKGDGGNALTLLRKAQSLDPKDQRVYLLLGTASLLQKNYVQALKEFEESLKLDPDRIEALNSIAVTMVQQGDRKTAMARVEKHLGKTKMPAGVHQLLGQLSLEGKEFDKGIQQLRRAIQLKPDLISAYFLIANAYIAQNKIDQAKDEYQKIIEKNPNDPGAHTILGSLYDHKDDYARANEHYERALKITGNFAPAANTLAWNYVEHGGNLDLALPLAQKAREVNPDSPQILDTLGWIYYKRGLFDNAVALLKDSSEKLKNGEPTVLYHLGMAYHRSGRKVEARATLNKALALNRNFPGADEARKVLAEPLTR